MPVYEFVCKRCAHAFEELVMGSEGVVCPKCSGSDAEKQFSVFGTGGSGAADVGSAPTAYPNLGGGCGTCGDPRGPGACSMN
jgi:putative FmdB family regulatory protein